MDQPYSPDTFMAKRPALLGLAYRMLGSRAEAEDVVQEAWIRWDQYQRGNGVNDPDAFLMQTVTNLCIDHYRSARVRRESYQGPWLPEPLLTEEVGPGATAASGQLLTMGMLHLMEALSPLERAVFVLVEAFGYTARETAALVQRQEAHCRQLLRRARGKVGSGEETMLSAPSASDGASVAELMNSLARGDPEALLASLSPEVVVVSDGGGEVAAASAPVSGVRAVSRFLRGIMEANRERHFQLTPCWVNHGPGLLIRDGDRLDTVMVLEHKEGAVTGLYFVRNPAKLASIDFTTQPIPVIL